MRADCIWPQAADTCYFARCMWCRRHTCSVQVRNSAGEDSREGVYVTSTNEEALTGSKGTCNFQVKWVRDARSSAYLNVQDTVKGVTQRAITGALCHRAVTFVGS